MKRIIWQNYDVQVDQDFYNENYPEMTQDQRVQDAYETNLESLEFARQDLDIQLTNPILAIASIGTWRGRFQGSKLIKSGNIKDILYSECDYAEWYSDGHNIKARMSHHDGTNYVEYREVREGVGIQRFMHHINSNGKLNRNIINRYTKSLHPYVAKVYGWK